MKALVEAVLIIIVLRSNSKNCFRADLADLRLADLRLRVEQDSARVKFRLKADAQKAGQELWFTPPHIGKYLSPIELL